MIDILVITVSALAASGLTYLTLDKTLCDKAKVFSILSEKTESESLAISNKIRLCLTIAMALTAAAATAFMMHRVLDWTNRIRMILILEALVAAGWIDLREKRIPNIIPAFLVFAGVILLLVIYIKNGHDAQAYLVSCLLAFFGPAVVLFIVSTITHMGIGAGDIKLICALGLIGGVNLLCGTIIFGTLLCAVTAVVLLIWKKKNLKSTLPFGPFLMAGYILCIFLYNY